MPKENENATTPSGVVAFNEDGDILDAEGNAVTDAAAALALLEKSFVVVYAAAGRKGSPVINRAIACVKDGGTVALFSPACENVALRAGWAALATKHPGKIVAEDYNERVNENSKTKQPTEGSELQSATTKLKTAAGKIEGLTLKIEESPEGFIRVTRG